MVTSQQMITAVNSHQKVNTFQRCRRLQRCREVQSNYNYGILFIEVATKITEDATNCNRIFC